jgi:hypothetical protein
MTRCWLALSIALLLITSCSSAPEPDPPAAAPAESAIASGDTLTGTWSGDWGPSENDRNDVTLELKWDGTNLSGTVNPGPNAVELSKAAYDPNTGVVMMEADAQGRGGATVHYVIEGKLEGNMITGTWNHDQRAGDFKITKG